MTTLHEAIEEAIGALDPHDHFDIIAKLQRALAQQGEPVAWVDMVDGVPTEQPRLWQEHSQDEVALYTASQPLTQPESFEQWNAKQHGDPEEIGFLQALRIAYLSGQDSVKRANGIGADK